MALNDNGCDISAFSFFSKFSNAVIALSLWDTEHRIMKKKKTIIP